jgi:hypothetical protein
MKTVNELLIIMKAVRERITDLKKLREDVSKKERFYGSTEKVTEPQYDVKKVDLNIVELQNWIYSADALIKSSNAMTKIDIDVNLKELLKPLE